MTLRERLEELWNAPGVERPLHICQWLVGRKTNELFSMRGRRVDPHAGRKRGGKTKGTKK